MTDDAKKLVLARRARFVAAAMAGVAIACGKERAPAPCLEMALEPDSGEAQSQPCLSVAMPIEEPIDASADAGTTRTSPRPPPRPCLSIAPPPRRDAGAPAPGCEPPYTLDAEGRKHYKKECL